jgi:hypothetical protein
MAEKLKRTRAKAKANGGDEPREGSNNFKVDRKEAKVFFDRLDSIHDEKESANSGFLADIKELYGEASDALGITKKAIRHVYGQHRQTLKRLAKEREMEADDIDQVDKLRLAIGSYVNTPLGKAAVEAAEIAQAEKELGA